MQKVVMLALFGALCLPSSAMQAQTPSGGVPRPVRSGAVPPFRVRSIAVRPFNVGHLLSDSLGAQQRPPQAPEDGLRPWPHYSSGAYFDFPVVVLVEVELLDPSKYFRHNWDAVLSVAATMSDDQPGVRKRARGGDTIALNNYLAFDETTTNHRSRSWLPFLFYINTMCEGDYEFTATIQSKLNGPTTSQLKKKFDVSFGHCGN